MKSESFLHCVTCWQPLAQGLKQPGYFAQEDSGWKPGFEDERAAGDLSRCLRHAKAVTSAMWNFLQIAQMNSPEIEEEQYLDSAKSLRWLLADLIAEIDRRAEAFVDLVEQKQAKTRAKRIEASAPQPRGTSLRDQLTPEELQTVGAEVQKLKATLNKAVSAARQRQQEHA